MSQKIELKRATLEDIDDILAIEKNLDGTKIYSAMTDKKDVAEEVTDHFFYVIKQNGEVVGDVSYEMKDEHHVYLSGLAIMPQFQGKGIARQAIKMILEKLKDVELIDLMTHPENEKAINLYSSLGFKKTGEKYQNYFGDGEPRIKMVLERE